MKKIILILMCFIILISLCGCGKNNNNSNHKEQTNINEKDEQNETINNDLKEETQKEEQKQETETITQKPSSNNSNSLNNNNSSNNNSSNNNSSNNNSSNNNSSNNNSSNNNSSNNNSSNNNSSNNNSSNNTTSNNNSTEDCQDCLKYVEIGNYVGMNVFDALNECEKNGIDAIAREIMDYTDGYDEYTVINQNGIPGGKYIKDIGLVLKLTIQSKNKLGQINLKIDENIHDNLHISGSFNSKIISIDREKRTINSGVFIDYNVEISNYGSEILKKIYTVELYDSNNTMISSNTIDAVVETNNSKTYNDKFDLTNKVKDNEKYTLIIK